MKYEDLKIAMNAPGFSVMKCSNATGIHILSIYNIRTGKTKKPNPLTIKALEAYLKKQGLGAV